MIVRLRVRGVFAGYDPKLDVIRDITCEAHQEETIAIVGGNGAGKSTLLRTLYALLPLHAGTLEWSTCSAGRLTPADLVRSGVAYVPQACPNFQSMTVEANLRVCAAQRTGISPVAERVTRELEAWPALQRKRRLRASALSGGERQTLAIACALATDPSMVLLDEPTLGLDRNAADQLFGAIVALRRQRQFGVLVVEHRLADVVNISDRVWIMKHGAIVYDGVAPSDVQALAQLLV